MSTPVLAPNEMLKTRPGFPPPLPGRDSLCDGSPVAALRLPPANIQSRSATTTHGASRASGSDVGMGTACPPKKSGKWGAGRPLLERSVWASVAFCEPKRWPWRFEFRGKLAPPDPAVEPAEKLPERLKAKCNLCRGRPSEVHPWVRDSWNSSLRGCLTLRSPDSRLVFCAFKRKFCS